MKNKKGLESVLSIVLILSVVLGNFSIPIALAIEKKDVNFEQVRTQTLPDKSGAILNKLNPLSKDVKDSFLDLSLTVTKNENSVLRESQQITERKGDYVEGEILVKYKKAKIDLETTAGRDSALNFNKTKSVEKKEDLRKNNISVLKIKDAKTVEQKIAELKNDPNIEFAEPNYKRYPSSISTNDTLREQLWGLDNTGQTITGTLYGGSSGGTVVTGTPNKDINAPEAWAINEGTNNSIIVAIIDSGVAYNHIDLISNMWDGSNCKDENGNSLGSCNHGYDFEDGDETPLPTTSSHGTHIAGTIAAVKNNSKGIVGVAPQAKIMAIKFGFDTVSEVKSIDFAIQNGAKVINASYGGGSFSQSEYDAINRFKAAGGIFIAAAMNEGSNNESTHFYPSDYDLPNIISVAATDQNDGLATFSNYGVTSVDVGAPGVNILSTIADTTILNETFENITPPAVPNGWVKGGTNNNWGTYNLEGSLGNVLYGYLYSSGNSWHDTNSTVMSPNINLNVVSGASIEFDIRCDTEYYEELYDFIGLDYSSDGSTFDPIFAWNEYRLDDDYDSTNLPPIRHISRTIPSQYLTSNFKFQFRWRTDSMNYPDQNYDGCLVNNIKITKFSDGSDEKYDYYPGTSMAAPHVAGLAALIEGYNPNLTIAQVKDVILNTGDSISALLGKTVTGKRVNAFNALSSLAPPVISNIQTATTTATSTNIIWSTDELSTSKVAYSTTTPVASTIIYDDTLVTSHSLELSNLIDSTTYYYYTESADEHGNIASSTEQSFTTSSIAPDETAPVITAPVEQIFEATGTSTTPTLVEATATDNIDSNPVITYDPHSFSIGTTTVTWTATDTSENLATTTSNVIITDTVAASATYTISGTIKYYDEVKVIPDATVILEDGIGTEIGTTTTDINGDYQFTGLTSGDDYIVRMEYDDSYSLSGISVMDLIKTKKHIISNEVFDSTFKVIAGDVNDSESVSVMDLIKMKKYILQIENISTTSWKFYSSEASLDETNYLTDGLTRIYSNLSSDMTDQNFTAVKMGDVNNSWDNN